MSLPSVLIYRFAFGCLFMMTILLWRKQNLHIRWGDGLRIMFLSILYAVSAVCLFSSYEYMPGGIATTLLFSYPVWTEILLILFFNEKLTIRISLAILLAIAGVAFLGGIGQSDGIDGIDGTEDVGAHLPLKSDIELSPNVKTMLDYADIDIGTIFDDHAGTISPPIEAAIASAASRGVFLVDEHLKRTGERFTLCGENGLMQTIQYTTDDHAVIKDADGHQVGHIVLDHQNVREEVQLTDGFSYTIDKTNGTIIDADGKLLGKIKDGQHGDRLLVNREDEVIRKYQADGFILNGKGNLVGTAAIA